MENKIRHLLFLIKRNWLVGTGFLIYCVIVVIFQSPEKKHVFYKYFNIEISNLLWNIPMALFVIWITNVLQIGFRMYQNIPTPGKFLNGLCHCKSYVYNRNVTKEISILTGLVMTKVFNSMFEPIEEKYLTLENVKNELYLEADDMEWIEKNSFETMSIYNMFNNIEHRVQLLTQTFIRYEPIDLLHDEWRQFKKSCQNLINKGWRESYFSKGYLTKLATTFYFLIDFFKFSEFSENLIEEGFPFFSTVFFLFVLVLYIILDELFYTKNLDLIYSVESTWRKVKRNVLIL